jgi:ABC-type amino acid transport substrate-binding protein
MVVRLPIVLAASLVLLAWVPPSRADDALSFCLDGNITGASAKDGRKARAFDVAVAQSLTRRLGRAPVVVWYKSETDRDSDPAGQMNALLSDGRCTLVLGYPLFGGALGEPRAQRARLPDFDGGKPEDRRRWVPLSRLVASRGYRFDPMVVVLGPGPGRRTIHSLADLKDMRLVVKEGTLADAALMSYDGGALIGRVTHLTSDPDLFESMERGKYDATLVELHRLDAYVMEHPNTRLSSSGHYHSVGFNIGIVSLAREPSLMAEVNAAIGDMLDKDEFPPLALASGVTYLLPREPNVLDSISPEKLRGD